MTLQLSGTTPTTPTEIDVLDWTTRVALEIVGRAGLGWSFDDMKEKVPNRCGDAIKELEYV